MQTTDNPSLAHRIFLWLYALLYILAGLNHFLSTRSYLMIMPDWLPVHPFLIYLSGILEIAFGLMLLFPSTRKLAAWLIILMLLAFMPVHIDMIQKAPFFLNSIEITPLVAWIRIPLQAFLIWWAWIYTRKLIKVS